MTDDQQLRRALVDQVTREVKDPRVLRIMLEVPRHVLVPEPPPGHA